MTETRETDYGGEVAFVTNMPYKENSMVLYAGCGNKSNCGFFYERWFTENKHKIITLDKDKAANPDMVADLEKPLNIKNRFDAILLLSVLEHTKEPIEVLKNLKPLLNPGGFLVISAPLMVKEHDMPEDYWRFTRFGMVHLLHTAGYSLDVIETNTGKTRFFGTEYIRGYFVKAAVK